MKSARRARTFFLSLSLTGGLLALAPPAVPAPQAPQPSAEAIERAVERAHAEAEAAGGRPGRLHRS